MRGIGEVNGELDRLYKELDAVQSMSEEAVRLTFNADNKASYVSLLNGEIDALEDELDEMERYRGRRRNFVKTEDFPFICM